MQVQLAEPHEGFSDGTLFTVQFFDFDDRFARCWATYGEIVDIPFGLLTKEPENDRLQSRRN